MEKCEFLKASVFFAALLITAFFLNDKFSKAVRVIAFNEGESESGAKISLLAMTLACLLWTVYFFCF